MSGQGRPTKISQVAMVVRDVDATMRVLHETLGWGPWNVYEHLKALQLRPDLRRPQPARSRGDDRCLEHRVTGPVEAEELARDSTPHDVRCDPCARPARVDHELGAGEADDGHPVDDECGSGVVEDRVDPQDDAHAGQLSSHIDATTSS